MCFWSLLAFISGLGMVGCLIFIGALGRMFPTPESVHPQILGTLGIAALILVPILFVMVLLGLGMTLNWAAEAEKYY